jgi:hypothetical protein
MNVFVYSMRDIKSDFMAPTYSSTKLIDSSNRNSVIKLSPKVSRITDNAIINGRVT